MDSHTRHSNCHVEPIEKVVDLRALEQAQTAFLLVWGMGCPACAMRVRNALLQLDGVLAAEIALERGLAQVWYDPARVTPDLLPTAVAAAGNDGRHRYTAQVLV